MTDVNIERRPDPKAELGYVCPECKEWSQVARWKGTEVGCEDCGDHPALKCPACEECIDEVYYSFEDPDGFLQRERSPVPIGPSARDIEILRALVTQADDRLTASKAEASDAKREAQAIRAAWLRAVGSRLLFRPDIVTALAETTTDMRVRLDELDEQTAGRRHAEMVAEYGPLVAAPEVEDV